jgi:hypothetical protein
MFSTPLKGTDKKKTTLNWWEYWIGHCWMTGWQSMRMNFRIWADLMGSNYAGYALMKEDDPEAECLDWFWASLNEDDVYPKEFLEHLMQMCEDVELGKVETYSWEEVKERTFKWADEVLDGVDLDEELKDDDTEPD